MDQECAAEEQISVIFLPPHNDLPGLLVAAFGTSPWAPVPSLHLLLGLKQARPGYTPLAHRPDTPPWPPKVGISHGGGMHCCHLDANKIDQAS